MALEQMTVASTRWIRNIVLTPRNPSSNPKFSYLIRYPTSLRVQHLKGKRNNGWLNLKVKCCDSKDEVLYPKPSEVIWKKELCNSVSLIGAVAVPVEIKHFPSGKVVAWTRLTVKKIATQTSWINLTFWDELAHVAFQHVEKRHQICVSGRLITDTVESDEGKQKTFYKVVVQQLNFIDWSCSTNDHESDYSTMPAASIEELWQSLFVHPEDWWDNRKNKRSPKCPDFKHRETGEALWVNSRSNPAWVSSQLATLDMKTGSLPDINATTTKEDVVAAS